MAAPKKRGLGKGLDALFSGGDEPAAHDSSGPAPAPALRARHDTLTDGSRLIEIDPHIIKPNPRQPRQYFDEETLQELAESIRRDGVQEPVVLRQRNGDYELVSGERRVRASILAELDAIPAVCREVSDDDMLRLGLIENVQREDLNPIELALGYRALIEHFNWTQDELAAQVGKKRATITNSIRLLTLPEDIQHHVMSGAISMGHARALLAIESPTRQRAMCEQIVEEGLSVRDVERATSTTRTAVKKKAAAVTTRNPHLTEIEDNLRRRFGTKVRISADPEYRGKFEIEFYNMEDLDRILDILRS